MSKSFVVTIRTIDGSEISYSAIASHPCDLIDAALLTFGVCKVTATLA